MISVHCINIIIQMSKLRYYDQNLAYYDQHLTNRKPRGNLLHPAFIQKKSDEIEIKPVKNSQCQIKNSKITEPGHYITNL